MTARARKPMLLGKKRLEEMIEAATVDAHDESEQAAGWYTMLEDNLALPFETKVLEVPVRVERLDLTERDQIVAICTRGKSKQALPITDLPLPSPPPEGAEWIEAYRCWSSGSR
jgi:hypothetical protein